MAASKYTIKCEYRCWFKSKWEQYSGFLGIKTVHSWIKCISFPFNALKSQLKTIYHTEWFIRIHWIVVHRLELKRLNCLFWQTVVWFCLIGVTWCSRKLMQHSLTNCSMYMNQMQIEINLNKTLLLQCSGIYLQNLIIAENAERENQLAK